MLKKKLIFLKLLFIRSSDFFKRKKLYFLPYSDISASWENLLAFGAKIKLSVLNVLVFRTVFYNFSILDQLDGLIFLN